MLFTCWVVLLNAQIILHTKGASANMLSGEGVPVLSLAVHAGCLKCTEALVEGGAELGAQAKG